MAGTDFPEYSSTLHVTVFAPKNYTNDVNMTSEDALTTLTLLEARLSRLELLLSSYSQHDETTNSTPLKSTAIDNTVAARLQKLENDFNRLTTRSVVVRDILRLCMLGIL